MHPMLSDNDARSERTQDLNELIEKGFLLLGSLQFQIQEHLLANGARLPTETRYFLAQVRDAAGDAAQASRVGAEERIVSAGHEAVAGAGSRAWQATRRENLPAVPEAARHDPRRVPTGGRRARVRRLLGVAAPTAAGVLCGLLIGGVIPDREAPSGPAFRLVSAAPERAALAPAPGVVPPVVWAGAAAPSAAVPDHAARSRLAVRVRDRAGQGGYPGPRALFRPLRSPAGPDPAAFAAAERALGLSADARREVQRRLRLAGFDPKAVDGIFGPDTRAAIGTWQEARGRRPTGFLGAGAFAALLAQTETAYRDWRRQVAAERQAEARAAVAQAPVPPPSPERGRDCRRDAAGRIVYGTSVGCDFAGLRETIAGLFGRDARPREVAQADREPREGDA